MVRIKIFLCLLIAAHLIVSCHGGEQKVPLTRDCFADMVVDSFHLSETKIRNSIADLMFQDKDMQVADRQTKKYYQTDAAPLLWVSRDGVRHDADSVVSYVMRVADMGFDVQRFRVAEIKADIEKVRTLTWGDENINTVYARLEYNLTKAYLRYCIGQRTGYTSPSRLFNRLDVHDSDSVHVSYQTLFDMHIKTAGTAFTACALRQIGHDSAAVFMRASEPRSRLYPLLQARLAATRDAAERMRIMVNMERCRWDAGTQPGDQDKYVLLNIPSQELDAFDGDRRLSMRVVCGSMKTKTPLLYSNIERIDINPQWIMPRSIVKKSVAHHAGSTAYFESHRYFIMERKTGKTVSPAAVTAQMLVGGDYLVIQKGGKGNALGRMIFRFKNNLSVYLHDTSNPGLFSSSDRLASHGCVRVQRPYDLAAFLLGDGDEQLLERIRYSVSADLTDDGASGDEQDERAPLDKSKLIRSAAVKPAVPLFITYYTLYKSADGALVSYPDIYGYDRVVAEALKRYM